MLTPRAVRMPQLAGYRQRGAEAKAAALEELLGRVRRWRDGVAEELGMAPAAVLPEHVIPALPLRATHPKRSTEYLCVGRQVGVRVRP